MKRTVAFFFVLSFIGFGRAQVDTSLTNQLQDVLDISVTGSGNYGVSAYLILENGESWSGTAGVGTLNLPITDTTVFHGASTTKLNIATLILLLAEDGLIDLDESWNNYISLDIELDPIITVRQLLNHTSGIADYLETSSSGSDIVSDFNYFFTPEFILENVVSDVPDFVAGTSFNYSNSNYLLAAFIAQTVTGNPVQVELRNRIWNPLNMHHTYFGAHETYTEPTAGVWWNFGNGLTNYNDEPTTSMLSYAYGAGNIVTCPKDLALLINGIVDGQLLSAASLEQMFTFVPSSYSSWTAGYGLGIHHYYQQDGEVIGHDGYYSNLTDMFRSIDCGFTLVTMSNTQTSWSGIFDPMYDVLMENCIATQLPELDDETKFAIYPNPARNKFTIHGENIIEEIMISDVLGNNRYHAFPLSNSTVINLEKEGIYFVTIKFENMVVTRKLLVE